MQKFLYVKKPCGEKNLLAHQKRNEETAIYLPRNRELYKYEHKDQLGQYFLAF